VAGIRAAVIRAVATRAMGVVALHRVRVAAVAANVVLRRAVTTAMAMATGVAAVKRRQLLPRRGHHGTPAIPANGSKAIGSKQVHARKLAPLDRPSLAACLMQTRTFDAAPASDSIKDASANSLASQCLALANQIRGATTATGIATAIA